MGKDMWYAIMLACTDSVSHKVGNKNDKYDVIHSDVFDANSI
jgi:hypothetical protein